MENTILFDDDIRDQLLPLTFTRPICELRVGILTIREKWQRYLPGQTSFITQEYLSEKYPIEVKADNFIVNGSVLPSEKLLRLIKQLDNNEALLQNGELIAARLDEHQFQRLMKDEEIEELIGSELDDDTPFLKINHLWDLFQYNGQAIQNDYDLLTMDRESAPIPGSNYVKKPENIFIEEGAIVEGAFLNATDGPIYIGKEAVVMEGSMIRGPFALCEQSQVKMGAKIYGPTTIGPYSKVGGEVNNSILTGFSNKSHDGFLGNSILGEWCNLGADTNNSNLKNNYGNIKLWSYAHHDFIPTNLQFCGLIMGDHSKTGINTMLNTGTVVGVGANIFNGNFPPKFIPSFTWGGTTDKQTYQLEKAFEAAERVMKRRHQELTVQDKTILSKVFDLTLPYRTWELTN